jgi:GH24 family phage-related lysozyme (muramidase)
VGAVISSDLQQLLNNLKRPDFEGNVPWMYVDTVGKVTVGVGHNVSAHKDLLALPFLVKRFMRHHVIGGDVGKPIVENKAVDRPATAAEKQNDYDFLVKHKGLGNYLPTQLQRYTTLELQSTVIDRIFADDLAVAVAVARNEFGDAFDTYKVPCQAALIDIAFNCGSFSGFQHRLVPAIKGTGEYAKKTAAERWKIASEASNRPDESPARNALVAQWLLNGAADTAVPAPR